MMIGKPLLVIMVVVGLMGVCGDSEGNDNPCSDPDNPDMVQCRNKTIEVKAGDTVILPCSKNKTDISPEHIEWSIKDPATGEDKVVHVYRQGEDQLHKQRDDFKNRTSLFKDQLSSGNCSLSLLVAASHSGTYHGCVGGHLYCTVTLKVLSEDDTITEPWKVTESPHNPPSGTDGLTIGGAVGGVLGVAALIIIITLAYYYHEQLMNFCSQRRNANNPQNYQGVPLQAQQPPENQENEAVDQNQNEDRRQMNENEDQDDPADDN